MRRLKRETEWLETFERRVLLSAALPINGIVPLNGAPAINLQPAAGSANTSASSFVDDGDFYYVNGAKQKLLRATDSIVVALNKVSHPVATFDDLSAPGRHWRG